MGYVGTLWKVSPDDHCALLLPIVFNEAPEAKELEELHRHCFDPEIPCHHLTWCSPVQEELIAIDGVVLTQTPSHQSP